jgi:hypothetical protein
VVEGVVLLAGLAAVGGEGLDQAVEDGEVAHIGMGNQE